MAMIGIIVGVIAAALCACGALVFVKCYMSATGKINKVNTL
jgi:hypothetical protein